MAARDSGPVTRLQLGPDLATGERPLAIVMIGGLVTSTLFTLLALPSFYLLVHRWQERLAGRLSRESDESHAEA